jgi:Transcriptional Coactivator p15 (PC4)
MGNEHTSTVYVEWNRNDGDVTRLIRQEYNGHDLLHLRIFYFDKDGKLKPTAKGVTIPHDQIAPLRKALRKAKKELNTNATDEAQPVRAKKKTKRDKKSAWGASLKSESPPWE